jgi:hypothetical protein
MSYPLYTTGVSISLINGKILCPDQTLAITLLLIGTISL